MICDGVVGDNTNNGWKNNEKLLDNFVSTQKDRAFQIWERNPLSVELYNLNIVNQKLEYIHQNPCTEKWMLSKFPDDYKYSSCRFYYNQFSEFNFITHINDLWWRLLEIKPTTGKQAENWLLVITPTTAEQLNDWMLDS